MIQSTLLSSRHREAKEVEDMLQSLMRGRDAITDIFPFLPKVFHRINPAASILFDSKKELEFLQTSSCKLGEVRSLLY